MRIVHAADIHLDSPLRGLSRLPADVASELREASRRALENLVRLVIDEKAQALVLAGDIYDGDWRDYTTGRFFHQQMATLHDYGIPVFMAAGNHDAESEISRALTLPPNVTVLQTDKPETRIDDDLGLAVHGQGFPTRAVTENLVLSYPGRLRGFVNVGILHTAVTGAEGHDTYAPCRPEDLKGPDYDYFALGHVHQHRVVNDGDRVAAFSGNLQGRHPRETGPKGALVVDVEADEAAQLRLVPLDVARWAVIDVDATGAASLDDVLAAAKERLVEAKTKADGRLLVARVTVTGRTRAAGILADRERLQEELTLLAQTLDVTVERAVSRAQAPDYRQDADPEFLESVSLAGRQLAGSPQRLRELVKFVDRDFGSVLRSAGGIDLRDSQTLSTIAEEAIDGLLARLTAEED